MANDVDFVWLYQQLGAGPESSVEALRLAYRRCVARIHPDRTPASGEAPADLQRLNASFKAVLEFHQRHGRLPGSQLSAPLRPPVRGVPTRALRVAAPSTYRRWIIALLLLASVIAVTLMYSHIDESDDLIPAGPQSPEIGQAAPAAHRTAPPRVELGMEQDDVLRIEGAPVARSDELWQYGPSWIRFACHTVTGWYSSPMRPLKVATREPAPNAPRKAIARIGCNSSGSIGTAVSERSVAAGSQVLAPTQRAACVMKADALAARCGNRIDHAGLA